LHHFHKITNNHYNYHLVTAKIPDFIWKLIWLFKSQSFFDLFCKKNITEKPVNVYANLSGKGFRCTPVTAEPCVLNLLMDLGRGSETPSLTPVTKWWVLLGKIPENLLFSLTEMYHFYKGCVFVPASLCYIGAYLDLMQHHSDPDVFLNDEL